MFDSCLPPVVCRRVDILFTLLVFASVVVSNTYYVVFLSCFSLPCVHYGASFSGFSIFDSPKFLIWYSPTFIYIVLTFLSALHRHAIFDTINTVVSNHFHSVKILLFSIDHMMSMECSAFDFRCQCSQQKLQSIYAVFTVDPQFKKFLKFSIKDRYELNYFICIKDFNAETIISLKLNLVSFFICCCQHTGTYFW
jgi:hypothetical protein